MQKQVYFSVIIAAISFITVKKIQQASIDHYHFLREIFQKDGWFDFDHPSFTINLPFELREISGITDFSEDQIACIQNQNGTLYLYSISGDSICEQYDFGYSGEFEGLTRVDSSYFIMRNDAVLLQVDPSEDSVSVNFKQLNIPSWDNEVLCVDSRDHRLLVAPKNATGRGAELKNTRGIYTVDLETMAMNDDPLFTINISELESFGQDNAILLTKKKKLKSAMTCSNFMPSCIAVHPKTDEVYVVSSVDHSMAVFEKSGKLINFVRFNKSLFTKPERILFLPNGDLVITNEGQQGKTSLLRFKWHLPQ